LLKRSCGKELEIKTTANANDYQHRITVKAHIQVKIIRYYNVNMKSDLR
jgi:hypothetical protein